MDSIGILTGLFFFFIGYLVKAYPNTIAGYNTMSKERKSYVDIEGLSSFMKRAFIWMGFILIMGSIICQLFGWEWMAQAVYVGTILFGVIYIVVRAQQFDHFS
jgi:hypothetical protein